MADASFRYEVSEAIRRRALDLPESEEGTSCVNRAFSAGGKNFAFLGEVDDECRLRLKLDDSIREVASRFEVGSAGWTMIRFSPEHPPSHDELDRWVVERYRLLAPKKISSQLDG